MRLPEYVTVEEVRKVCKALGIRDWSSPATGEVLPEEAKVILAEVNVEGMGIRPEAFRRGLEVELEHGTRFGDANVTNNHPILTGKIVLAHLKESLDYYERLEVAEVEGDMLKAIRSRNVGKIEAKYRELVKAQAALNQAVAEQLG